MPPDACACQARLAPFDPAIVKIFCAQLLLIRCVSLICIVVYRAEAKPNVFVHSLLTDPEVRLHAEPRPVKGVELIDVGGTSDQLEMRHPRLSIATPRVFFRPDKFIMPLRREQNVPHRSRIVHFMGHWDRARSEMDGRIAGEFSRCLFGFEVHLHLEPSADHFFESGTIPEVLDSVMRSTRKRGSVSRTSILIMSSKPTQARWLCREVLSAFSNVLHWKKPTQTSAPVNIISKKVKIVTGSQSFSHQLLEPLVGTFAPRSKLEIFLCNPA